MNFFNKCTQWNTVCGWLSPWMQNCGYGRTTSGLEHPRILVSTVGPGTNPLWLLREDCSLDGKSQPNFPYFSWFYIFGGFVMFLNGEKPLCFVEVKTGKLEMMMEF